MSLLSGGMDSHSVVCTLQLCGKDVITLNLADKGTQDLILGSKIAEVLKTHHTTMSLPASSSISEKITLATGSWLDSVANSEHTVQRPRLIWSGDGGSVGLGHCYLSEQIVDSMENGGNEEGIRALIAFK